MDFKFDFIVEFEVGKNGFWRNCLWWCKKKKKKKTIEKPHHHRLKIRSNKSGSAKLDKLRGIEPY